MAALEQEQATQQRQPQPAAIPPSALRPQTCLANAAIEEDPDAPHEESLFDEFAHCIADPSQEEMVPITLSAASFEAPPQGVVCDSRSLFDDMEHDHNGVNCALHGGQCPALLQSNIITPVSGPAAATSSVQGQMPNRDQRHQQALKISAKARALMLQKQLSAGSVVLSIVPNADFHIDGGANSNIATVKKWLCWRREQPSDVIMANGAKGAAEGFGFVLVRLKGHLGVCALCPAHCTPSNEWPALSPPAMRLHNGLRRASARSLKSFEIVNTEGSSFTTPTLEEQ